MCQKTSLHASDFCSPGHSATGPSAPIPEKLSQGKLYTVAMSPIKRDPPFDITRKPPGQFGQEGQDGKGFQLPGSGKRIDQIDTNRILGDSINTKTAYDFFRARFFPGRQRNRHTA